MPKATLLALLLLVCGCFRDLAEVEPEPGVLPTVALRVYDLSGGVWSAESSPRRPRFELQFDTPPARADTRLFLLRGAASEQTLADLRTAKHNASTAAQRVELAISTRGAVVSAQPSAPLTPGGAYTLVWVERADALELPVTVSRSPAAGASLAETLPLALDPQVPVNLERALLRFDGYVLGDLLAHIQLLDASGMPCATSLIRQPCENLGLPAGDCLLLEPMSDLAPRTRYRLLVSEGLTDATGAPIPAQEIAFDTTAEPDARAPSWQELPCVKDETKAGALCLLASEHSVTVRARADENGVLSFALAPFVAAAVSRAGEYTLSCPLPSAGRALLAIRDLAGNRTQLELDLEPARQLATLSIDEVRVDPLGPEPHQEYVELLNFGDQPVPLMGFTLTTDPQREGHKLSTALQLSPGERALVVAPDFDVQDRTDGEPPSAARVVRLSAPLSLKNDGAALYLRDPSGRRVSAAPPLAPGRPGQCIVRRDADPRSGAMEAFGLQPHGGCSPGRGDSPDGG